MNRALILSDGNPVSFVYLNRADWELRRGVSRLERVKVEGVPYQPAQWQINAAPPFDLPPGNYRVPVNATIDPGADKDGKFMVRVKVPLSTAFASDRPPWDQKPDEVVEAMRSRCMVAAFQAPGAAEATRAALNQCIADLTSAGVDVNTPTVPKETATMSTQNATQPTAHSRPVYRAQPKLRVIRPRLMRQSPAVTGDHRYEAVGKFWTVVANNMEHASAVDQTALLSVTRPPQVVQGTREHAEDVATKLARDNPGTEFHVLESVAKVRVNQQHVEQPVGYLEQL